MNTVIFACVHNAGRSQMAAAWFNALADATRARAISAGTEPAALRAPRRARGDARDRNRSRRQETAETHRRSSRAPRNCSSPWAAAKNARSSRA